MRVASASRRPAPDPLAGLARQATLPQRKALPPAHGERFAELMGALWQAIVLDSPQRAMPAFFPRAAYLQLKAIPAAGADYDERLLGELRLDIGAAHALLGAGAPRARLQRVLVPSQYAHWVQPGSCYNGIGYYEVPNARMVYDLDGQVRSFGIASLISWRGVWYVVHLGAVLRSGAAGVVDEPALGAGSSAYSSTC